ncbi:MAG TPA: hypothetical protein VMW38_11785 [Terriglobia bacterium]|nr:hypothetical protein [Terriglobia bacterium]
MTIYKDKTLEGEVLILEECIFMRCELKRCDLFYSGGDFNFVESRIEDCRVHSRGPAGNTVKLLEFMGSLKQCNCKSQPVEPSSLVN